jgi:type I restriction enzyme, S subunit
VSRETTRLADISEVITKGTTPTTLGFDFVDSGVPFLRVQDIDGGSVNYQRDTLFIDQATHDTLKRSQIQPGDVLVSIAGTIGRAGVVPEHAPALNCNQAVAIVRTNERVFRPFLRMWLESSDAQKQMRSATVTGTISNLSLTQIGNLEIPLPPLAEQRRIAEVLDRAEALRAKRRAALAQLDSLAHSLFLDFFGDPFSNPRGWPIFPFSEVCETTQGVQIPRDSQREEPSEGYERYLYINDFYSEDSPKYIENRYQQKRVTDNDLVMANTGSPGRVFKGRPGILSNNLFKITFDTKKLSAVFFYHFLASDLFQRHLQRQMKQGIQSHLGHKTFGMQRLPLPPIELQYEFARRAAAVEKLKAAHRASMAELDALFASLRHRAFRGDL